jgi:signal transduction histidine kinase
MLIPSSQQPDSATVRDLSRQLHDSGSLIEILQQLPYMALVVTARREAVFANRALLDTLGMTAFENILARRPGELLLCTHGTTIRGCGGAEGCRHCQTVQAIDEALLTHREVVREARISARVDGRLVAYDLKVTSRPLDLNGQPLVMVFLEDISAQKRREHLESIFLHDLLNTVGSLQLLAEFMQVDPCQVRPEEIARQVRLLTDEIRAQQLLLEAEQGELILNIQCVSVGYLVEEVLQVLEALRSRLGIMIAVELPRAPVYLATDTLIARRVLLNAVKNALEASTAGAVVKIGVVDGDRVAVTVQNAGEIPASIGTQVFQRSFSTKGKGRGLGTYSMRLLMENYLGGTVAFNSDAATGTTFTLRFPSMKSYLASAG